MPHWQALIGMRLKKPLDVLDFSVTFQIDLNLIGTSSIDTTCTVWQLEVGASVGWMKILVLDGPSDWSNKKWPSGWISENTSKFKIWNWRSLKYLANCPRQWGIWHCLQPTQQGCFCFRWWVNKWSIRGFENEVRPRCRIDFLGNLSAILKN